SCGAVDGRAALFCVCAYVRNGESVIATQQLFRVHFNLGCYGTILSHIQFSGCIVKKQPPGPTKTARMPDNIQRVRQAMIWCPERSAQRHAHELQLRRESVRTIGKRLNISSIQNVTNIKISQLVSSLFHSPLLSDLLYESEFESQLWMIFDSNKQLISTGDAYPSKYIVKVEKGDYVLKLHVRHEKKDLLDKLVDQPLLLSQKLPAPVTLDVYASQTQATTNGKKMVGLLKELQWDSFYLEQLLMQKMKLAKKMYILSKPGEQAQSLYEELKNTYPEHLAAHTAMLQCLEPNEPKKLLPYVKTVDTSDNSVITAANKVIAVAETVIGQIDSTQLLAYYGSKADHRADAPKIKTSMERQKAALIEALSRKGSAMCRIYTINAATGKAGEGDGQSSGSITMDSIDNVWREVLKFTDVNDSKVSNFMLWHSAINRQWGRFLKILFKLMEDKPTREFDEKACEVGRKLGWTHYVRYVESALPVKYPPTYRPF
ncbi:hypothetical protein C0J52_01886, partial [Blattella germanica]